MRDDSKFFKYFVLTDIGSLSKKERAGIVLVPSIFITILLLYMFIQSHDFSILLLLGIYVFFIGLAHPLIYFERYDKKYGFYSKIRFGGTYQMISKNFSFVLPGLVIIILTIGLILNNLNKSFLISFAFIIPFLALFFRIDVFNDNSSIIGDEIVLGYNPGYYGLLSLILGLYGNLKVYDLLKSDLNIAIILFCITALFQVLLLCPDKCNKILFFEIKRTKGFLAFVIPVILIFLIISSIIFNSPIVDLNNFDLSLGSIIRIVITWSIGIILAFLFVKQIKKMEEKKDK